VIRGVLAALSLLFVLSGAAGLFYEAVWSRYLALFVGHDAYAQILTLVIFLGGMGIGALVVSRWSHRLRDPLFGYAIVEALIGILGLAFHEVFYLPVTEWAYATLFPALGSGVSVGLAKWALAGALILPASILLGATFPLMSAGALRRLPERPGRTLSILYFTNSLGAAAGVLLAGYLLYGMVGLPGTLTAAAMLNLVVALGALVVCRVRPVTQGEEIAPQPSAARDYSGLARLLLLLAAGTAIASFVYEVAWLRMLSLVMGSSTHSFELMLSAFILGLALGAWWIRRRADRLSEPLRTLAIVQLAMGGLAIVSLAFYLQSFHWMATLFSAVSRSEEGFALYSVARYLICLAIMLPTTFCAGMTLPLITRMLMAGGGGGGGGERAIGAIYSASTFGSILGAAATGLILLPLLGLKGTLLAGGALDLLLGVAALAALTRLGRPAPELRFAAGTIAVFAGLVLLLVPWDQELLSSGVFRSGGLPGANRREILFHADGRTATVHATRMRAGGTRILSTNGKADGSLPVTWFERCDTVAPRRAFSGDDATQTLLAVLLLAHAPRAAEAAVIGLGTGMSSHLLLASPQLSRLTTVEIEPAMLAGARSFYPVNRRVYDDPRSRIVLDDARSFFAGANVRLDLMLSEPSNPWVSGVSGLFTTEFYAAIRRYLAPGAVFGQWLQTYELSDGLVLSVLSAVHRNFEDYRVYLMDGGNLLVVATPTGRLSKPDWSVTRLPALQHDLCRFLPMREAALDRVLLIDRAGLEPLLEGNTQVNSDFYPVLDLGAEQARFLRGSAMGMVGLGNGVLDYIGDPALRATSWDGDTTSVLVLTPRVRQMLRAVQLRRGWIDAGYTDDPAASERYLYRTWTAGAASSSPPANWKSWTSDFWTLRGTLTGGSAPPDSNFFALAAGYAERSVAPRPVRAAIDFGAALARRDLAGAAASADPLLAEARAGRFWIPADDLLDGSVRALLATGNVAAARAAHDMLRRRTTRAPGDLRLALLRAYLERAETAGSRTEP
jgi:predicted membrane-bound spermidine synthase